MNKQQTMTIDYVFKLVMQVLCNVFAICLPVLTRLRCWLFSSVSCHQNSGT